MRFYHKKAVNLLLFFCCCAFCLLIFVFSEELIKGINKGLLLSANTVIPSLFLFTVLCLFITKSELATSIGHFISPISTKLLGLSGEQTAVFLLSLFSGYPVGAKLISELYENEKVDRKTALSMLDFCINAGPAFILTAVGSLTLGSTNDGKRLLLAHIFSSLILAVITAGKRKSRHPLPAFKKTYSPEALPKTYISDAFVSAVCDATTTLFIICGFVVAFSGISGVVSAFPINSSLKNGLLSCLEVTVGIGNCNRRTLKAAAFLLGFGGLSVQLQVMAAAKSLKPSFFRIIIFRIAHGLLSALLIGFFEILSPRSLQTIQDFSPNTTATLSSSPLASSALIFMAMVLLAWTSNDKKRPRRKTPWA